MNERIKELINRAGFAPWVTEATTDVVLTRELEKFAELIVRECADYAEYLDLPGYKANMLKKHFGVEE